MVSRFERNKDTAQEMIESTAHRVGRIASIITGAVIDVTREIGDLISDGLQRGSKNVDAIVRQHARQIREQSATIESAHLNLHAERSAQPLLVPGHVDEALRLQLPQAHSVRARAAMHRDPLASGNEADDLVSGHRRTALGELDPDLVRTQTATVMAASPDACERGFVEPGVTPSESVSSVPSPPPRLSMSRLTAFCAEICPSPTAAYRPDTSGYPNDVATDRIDS